MIYLLPFMCMFKHVCKCKSSKGWTSIESIRGYGPLLTILVTLYDFYVFIWARLVTWRTINAFTKEFILFSLVSLFYLLSVLELQLISIIINNIDSVLHYLSLITLYEYTKLFLVSIAISYVSFSVSE